MPREFERLPEAVRNTQNLFRTDVKQAESFVGDGYYFDVQPARGQTYRARFDPVGRLRDIANPQEVERYETTTFEKADENTARRIQELADRHVPQGANLRDVYVDPRFPGFYVAKYQARTGEVLVIIDEQGNIYQTRTEIPRDQVPEPIMQAFSRMFDPNQLQYAYRTQYQFYQFQQPGPGGEQVTFRVRPNGAIMDVRGLEAEVAREDEAVTARYREGARGRRGDDRMVGPQQRDDRDRDRDRRR
jgi:hypothetical protein